MSHPFQRLPEGLRRVTRLVVLYPTYSGQDYQQLRTGSTTREGHRGGSKQPTEYCLSSRFFHVGTKTLEEHAVKNPPRVEDVALRIIDLTTDDNTMGTLYFLHTFTD